MNINEWKEFRANAYLVNDTIQEFIQHFILVKYKLNCNLTDVKSRTNLIELIVSLNDPSCAVLIKNLKEKVILNLRTSVYLLGLLYPDLKKPKIKSNFGIKLNLFKSYLNDLFYLYPILYKSLKYPQSSTGMNDYLERFYQDIYFVFKYLEKDLPPQMNKGFFFNINKTLKLLMLKNSQVGLDLENNLNANTKENYEKTLNIERRLDILRIKGLKQKDKGLGENILKEEIIIDQEKDNKVKENSVDDPPGDNISLILNEDVYSSLSEDEFY